MQTAQVIPFRFDTREVRTMLIDDQPWFVASDIAKALQYQTAKDMARNLDDDERGRQIVPTPSGEQEMTIINESGLYSAILRSRKAEAKRFKKWVTAEVLPAIRKHGRYEDAHSGMATLIGQTIGTDGFHCLAAVVDGKLRNLPVPVRKRAKNHIWQQVHRAFSVVRAEDIPAAQLDSARNFIAAYSVIEGEWIEREPPAAVVPRLNIHFPLDALVARRQGMLSPYNEGYDTLQVTLEDLSEPRSSFCEAILTELSKNGYAVDAAWWEFRTYRNKFAEFRRLAHQIGGAIEEPQRYVVSCR